MARPLRFLLPVLLSALFLCAVPPGAEAADAAASDGAAAGAGCAPTVAEGWLRSPPVPMPVLAGFATVANPCAGDVAITGARSAAFASVELHETALVDGVVRMRAVDEVPVPAGGEAVLRPGGLHLMLMSPVAPLAAGDVARVEFILADGRSISADFEVRAPDAR